MRRSELQYKIMLSLPEKSITRLSNSLGIFQRSSVSRCLHHLRYLGLVCKNGTWQLTEQGRAWLNKMSKFELAKSVSIQWSDVSICFDCECGIKEIILSEGGEEKTCDCGRVYRIVFKLEVNQGLRIEPQTTNQ